MLRTENLYHPNHIRTFTGQYVNVLDPQPETILIEDIAHHLANNCRFGGALPTFYSVAQHSYLTAWLVEDKYKLAALLHDASEAYLQDIPSPVKNLLTNYKEIENRFMRVIAKKWGFMFPLPIAVKEADTTMLEMEWNALMLGDRRHWQFPCLEYRPETAEQQFLIEYERIMRNEKSVISNQPESCGCNPYNGPCEKNHNSYPLLIAHCLLPHRLRRI